jgi:hypothetical protein
VRVLTTGRPARGLPPRERHTPGEESNTVSRMEELAIKQPVRSPEPVLPERAPSPATLLSATPVEAVLAMQRTAGNASVVSFLARDPSPTAAATTLPTAEVLTTRISNCVGVWETNRGGDAPAPTESSLDTVAAVKASMATIEQATMPYALDALRKYESLRKLASPELTKKEIDDAIARTTAVKTLMDAVKTAADAGTSADDFIKAQQGTITPSGLSDDNVKTMFSAVALKETIDEKHTELSQDKKKSGKTLAEGIPEADRLGLGTGSLSAYIKDPKKWGENRAAWQRLAVNNMPGDVGTRINSVATSSGGTALAGPVIRSRVDAELAKTPQPTEEALVKTVGAKNNANETGYGDNIWKTYQRLYPAAAPAAQAPAATP